MTAEGQPDEPFECPFCRRVVAAQVIVMPALHAFELHLDTHMARGDRIAVAR